MIARKTIVGFVVLLLSTSGFSSKILTNARLNKTCHVILLLMMALVGVSFSQVPELVENWPYFADTCYYSVERTPRFSTIFTADEGSIYFTETSGRINRFYLNGLSYGNWPFMADSIKFYRTPIVVDLDFDGLDEVVTYGVRRDESGYLNSLLYIIDDDGSVFNGFPISHNKLNLPNVADFDNDGEYELIYYSSGEELIYCIDTGGNLEPGWPIPVPDELYGSKGAGGSVGDLDGDGTIEFLLKGLENIYCYNHDGTNCEGFPLPVYEQGYYYNEWWGPSLGDIDNDGDLEIAISAFKMVDWEYSSFVAIYEHTGVIREEWPRYFPGQFALQMPIISDINGDSELELGFTVDDLIYFIDHYCPNVSFLGCCK